MKLPAYGKRLLDERRAGKHPLEVTLVYGDDWYVGKLPRICIKPDEFEPAKYDFRMLAGLRVNVFDEFGLALKAEGKVFDLLGELGQIAAAVWVRWPLRFGQAEIEMTDIALRQRIDGVWPHWWNAEVDQKYLARFDAWFADLMAAHKSPIEARGRA